MSENFNFSRIRFNSSNESAKITMAPNNSVRIKIGKSVTDLSRFKELKFSSSYLYAKDQSTIFPLSTMQDDGAAGDAVAESTSESGRHKVVIRKCEAPSKDLYMEVWSDATSGAFTSSLKLSKEVSACFVDPVFGRISWSKDETKVCFIGEVPVPAEFKSPWENKKSEDEKKKADDKEEEKEEHWQEEKFLHHRDYGEALVGRKQAGIFIFDLKANKINQVLGLPEDLSP